jgi:hypothetical protein
LQQVCSSSRESRPQILEVEGSMAQVAETTGTGESDSRGDSDDALDQFDAINRSVQPVDSCQLLNVVQRYSKAVAYTSSIKMLQLNWRSCNTGGVHPSSVPLASVYDCLKFILCCSFNPFGRSGQTQKERRR